MPIPGNFNNALVNAALRYVEKGWSLIPLRGSNSPHQAKLPAIPSWKPYQLRRPTYHEIEYWFDQCDYTAMGIVLGKVSGLVVLDMDCPQRDEDFRQMFPEFLHTMVVRSGTRHLPHYYFSIEPDSVIPSRSRAGAELRSEGCYVVAPQTRVHDLEWRLENDGEPIKLKDSDLRRIIAWIDGYSSISSENRENRPSGAESSHLSVSDDPTENRISSSQLVRLYQRLVVDHGRNNALYRSSGIAQAYGLSQKEVEEILLDTHISQPAVNFHKPESPMQRKAEGLRTIQSAFAKTSESKVFKSTHQHRQLSNALREWFLANDLTNAARVLDGLLICGVKPGAVLTADSIYEDLCQFGIGRNTIYRVLRSTLTDGSAIFKILPPHTPPTDSAYADSSPIMQTKQCLFGGDSNSVKTIGRPKSIYLMPDPKDLCDYLELDHLRGDKLEQEALASPAKYRQALHSALINRSPGQYPRRWLAERLGISRPTCRRYDRSSGICSSPVYERVEINWQDVDRRIPDEPEYCFSLEDETGKKYPALRNLARKLLAAGRRLMLLRQQPNYYHANRDHAGNIRVDVKETQDKSIAVEGIEAPVNRLCHHPPQSAIADELSLGMAGIIATPLNSIVETFTCSLSKMVPENYPVNNQQPETTEHFVYRKLRELCPSRSLTRKRIRGLIEQYGDTSVRDVLQTICTRSDLVNPAGYLIAILRKRTAESKPEHQESHAAWQQRIRSSKYAVYFANAADL